MRQHYFRFDIKEFTQSEIVIYFIVIIITVLLSFKLYCYVFSDVRANGSFTPSKRKLKTWIEADVIVTAVYALSWKQDYLNPFSGFRSPWFKSFIPAPQIGTTRLQPIVLFKVIHPETKEEVNSSARIRDFADINEGDNIKIKFNPKNPKEAIILSKA